MTDRQKYTSFRQKYTSLRGNQNAAKPESQRKQGFTLHKYIAYPYVVRIRHILGEQATDEQVREHALRICMDALEERLGDKQ